MSALLALMAGPPTDAFAGGFGIAAAIILVGGAILLRWQRTRLQFALMQTALEKGISQLPGSVPPWLLSLRHGVTILVLGIALGVVGAAVHHAASLVPVPTAAELAMDAVAHPQMDRQPGFGDMRPPDGMRRPPPNGGGFGRQDRPGGPPGEGQLPEGGSEDGRGNGPERGPGVGPMPPLERWHRAQDQAAVSLAAAAIGFILVLLGLVRIFFAFTERKYTSPTPTT